jgi:hypothetical protein
MKGAAERPGDASATPEPRQGRAPESATFASARVPGRDGRARLFLLGLVVVLAVIVGAAVVGRSEADLSAIPPGGPASPGTVAIGAGGTSGPTPSPRASRSSPGGSPDAAPVVTSGPGPIQVKARRQPNTMFVAGDVFAAHVTWIFVSLQDERGRVVGWASVSMPGAAGPAVGSGPTLRFAVELAVPADAASGKLWVLADAYDTAGALVANTRLQVDPDGTGADVSLAP